MEFNFSKIRIIIYKKIAITSLSIFTAFLINGLFEWNFGDQEIMILVWLSIGLAISAFNLESEKYESAFGNIISKNEEANIAECLESINGRMK